MKNKAAIIMEAIKLEQDGKNFYIKASKKTKNILGKKMFQNLAEDETRHENTLKKLLESTKEGKNISSEDLGKLIQVSCKNNFANIFERGIGEINDKVKVDVDDVDALKIAMDMESKGYEFYKNSAETFSDKEGKNIFKYLASEEIEHYAALENTAEYLENPAGWFLKEEKSEADGGSEFA